MIGNLMSAGQYDAVFETINSFTADSKGLFQC